MADVRLVTIHVGSLWEVELVAGRLEAEGIPTFLPDHLTKRVDPFITGANPLQARLQVREADAARATALLEDERRRVAEERAARGDASGRDEDAGEADVDELTPEEELQLLATRTRWWILASVALGFLVLPMAIFVFVLYLRACRAYRETAPMHGLTVAMVLIATVVGALVWILFLSALRVFGAS